jgi:hypothetical protein
MLNDVCALRHHEKAPGPDQVLEEARPVAGIKINEGQELEIERHRGDEFQRNRNPHNIPPWRHSMRHITSGQGVASRPEAVGAGTGQLLRGNPHAISGRARASVSLLI